MTYEELGLGSYHADETRVPRCTANKDYDTFLAQINPGNTVKGKPAFDVPTGTKLSYVVLHEPMFTPGVKIPLK
jgi:Domain of unknown function (DUF4352)